MRVIFMGTPDFAVGTLEEIIKAGHEVALVVTQPDKPKGRGKAMQFTPVKECALSHNIPVFQTDLPPNYNYIDIRCNSIRPLVLLVFSSSKCARH